MTLRSADSVVKVLLAARRSRLHLFAPFLLLAATIPVHAQTTLAPETTVVLDLPGRNLPGGALPFGQPIRLRGDVPDTTKVVIVRVLESAHWGGPPNRLLQCVSWTRQGSIAQRVREKQFTVRLLQPLHPDRNYAFKADLYDSPGGTTPAVGTDLCRLVDPSAAIVRTDSVLIRGATPSSYSQRFAADFGYVVSRRFAYHGVVSDVHYYLAAINKKEDIASELLSFAEGFERRVSVFAGLAIKDLGNTRGLSYPIALGAPAVGLGVRGPLYWSFLPHRKAQWLLQPMRLNFGRIWFQQKDPNPLIDKKHNKGDVFLSVTLDFDYSAVLGPFLSLVSAK